MWSEKSTEPLILRHSLPLTPLTPVGIKQFKVRSVSAAPLPVKPEHSTRLALSRMGFDKDSIEALLTYYQFLDFEQAVDFLLKGPSGWRHEFIPREAALDKDKCAICGEEYEEHRPEPAVQQKTKSIVRMLSTEIRPVRGISTWKCCGVCLASYSDAEMFSLSCNHYFCDSCVKDYLTNQITEGKVMTICCPEVNCGEEFEPMILCYLLTPELWAKYNTYKNNILVSRNPNARWCPTPNCGKVLYVTNSTPRLFCDSCKTQVCFTCGEPWHPGLTCQAASDSSYEDWAKGRNIQACPSCKRRIEKEAGCNHMTCLSCGHQWCWLCRSRYTELHFNSLNPLGCPGLDASASTRKRWPWHKRWILKILLLLFLPLSTSQTVIPIQFGLMLACPVNNSLMRKFSGWRRVASYPLVCLVFLFGCAMGPVLILVCAVPYLCYILYQFVLSVKFCLQQRSRH